MKKTMRKATRAVTRSSHEALHHIIEGACWLAPCCSSRQALTSFGGGPRDAEEGDLCKALEHVSLERDDSISYLLEWSATTGQQSMVEFVTGLEPLYREEVQAEGRFVLAQQAFIAMWKELLERERERDTLGKALAKAEDSVTKATEKLNSAQAAKRPAAEQKLNEAVAARDAAKAEYEPVAQTVAAFTRSHVKAGFQAHNNAYVEMLERQLELARQRQAIIDRLDVNAADVIAPPEYSPE